MSGIETNKPDQHKDETLIEFIDTYITTAKNRINTKTKKPISKIHLQNLRQLKVKLLAFSKQVRKVDFNTIDLDFYDKFTAYLFKQGYGINTVGKYIRQLKTILNDATDRGINTNYAYKSKKFVAANIPADTIYLNESELDELFYLDLSEDKKLERVRDLFLVGCYTGLRFSDFTNIKPENIRGDFFELTTQKTNTDVVVPIHPRLREIMARYEGKTINSLPPSISNQKMNEYLKEICAMVDILNDSINTKTNKGNFIVNTDSPKYMKVSTHTARRSFATNQYNKGIPASILMKITNHATESAFYRYIKVTPKENAQRLREVWAVEYPHLKVV
jgi:integrase